MTSCGAKQSISFGWGGNFLSTLFLGSFLYISGERFWDKNYLAHDIIFVKELFFPHKWQSFLFGKASFLGNGFEVLNQSQKRFHTKISPKCFCRNFFFFRQRQATQLKFFWDWFFHELSLKKGWGKTIWNKDVK